MREGETVREKERSANAYRLPRAVKVTVLSTRLRAAVAAPMRDFRAFWSGLYDHGELVPWEPAAAFLRRG